jgi:hypothetical protein
MTDKKTYSDPSRSGGAESEKGSHDRSLDRDREKNLGSRHSGESSSPGTPPSGGRSDKKDEGRSSSDRDR